MKKHVERRIRTVRALRELADAGLIQFQMARKSDGAEATEADLEGEGFDDLSLQIRKTGKSPDGIAMSEAALACWRGLTANVMHGHELGMRELVSSEPILGKRSGRRVRLSCGHVTEIYGSLGKPTERSAVLCPVCSLARKVS